MGNICSSYAWHDCELFPRWFFVFVSFFFVLWICLLDFFPSILAPVMMMMMMMTIVFLDSFHLHWFPKGEFHFFYCFFFLLCYRCRTKSYGLQKKVWVVCLLICLYICCFFLLWNNKIKFKSGDGNGVWWYIQKIFFFYIALHCFAFQSNPKTPYSIWWWWW